MAPNGSGSWWFRNCCQGDKFCCKAGPTVLRDWNPGLSLSPNGSKSGSRTASKAGCGELTNIENMLAHAVFVSGRIFLGHISFPKGLFREVHPSDSAECMKPCQSPLVLFILRLLFKFFLYRHQSVGWYGPYSKCRFPPFFSCSFRII